MSLTTWKVLGGALAAVCLIAAAACLVVGGCDACVQTADGGCVPMKCHYAVRAAALVEAMAALSCAALCFVKCKVGRRWLAVSGIAGQALALVVLYTPYVGICANAAMKCHLTAHAVAVCAGIVAVGCCVALAKADPTLAALPKRGL